MPMVERLQQLSPAAAPGPQLPPKRYFACLDGIRGVAAAIVTFGHVQEYFGLSMGTKGYLAVDIFFLLSGVVIANAYELRFSRGLSTPTFTTIRLIRFHPLYLFGTAIGLLTMLLGFEWRGQIGDLRLDVLLAIAMLPNPLAPAAFPLNPPAWSLFSELVGNVLYACIWRFLTTLALVATVGAFMLALVALLWLQPDHDLNVGWSFETLYGGLLRVGFSFFAGVLLFRLYALKLGGTILGKRFALAPYGLFVLVALMLGGPQQPIPLRPLYDFAAVTLLFPAIIFAALWLEPGETGTRICRFAGSLSYAVYAVHMPLFWLFGLLLTKATGLTGQNLAPWAGFAFLALLAPLCVVLDQRYDVPLRRALTRMFVAAPAASRTSKLRPEAGGGEAARRTSRGHLHRDDGWTGP